MKSLKFLLFSLFIVILLLFALQAFTQVDTLPIAIGTDTVTTTVTDTSGVTTLQPVEKKTVITFLKEHWSDILLWFLPLLWFIVRLTPTEKDDDIIKILLSWLDALVPNRKAGGGVHATYTNASTAPGVAYVPKKQ